MSSPLSSYAALPSPKAGRSASAGSASSAAAGDGTSPHDPFRRTIGPFQLSFLAFFAVCAGPYGIEDAVGAAGALPTLIGALLLPLFWGLPQGLMTAELSNTIDQNGGYILWVNNILGPFWGWMNAWNSAFCNIFDLSLYPVMFACYVEKFVSTLLGSTLPDGVVWALKAFAIVAIMAFNFRGMEVVGFLSVVLTIIMVAPFLVEFVMAAPHVRVEDWGKDASNCDCPLEEKKQVRLFTVVSEYCAVYSVQCAVYSVQCVVCSVQCAVCSV